MGNLTLNNSKLSIQDMVESTKRNSGTFGIDGKFLQ